ncbi:hypothetical protein NA56DRAFT_698665 [Hyaloscypha hepaticicola]|uniref:Uncharacterized protein n=1 Tax=Hyaloscypha hepaticicola TaxID=2082293 RepID=A0A2J6QH60_9HELO|nr:hypothetical protein NA56DRAFT_698665 [Hyaloscypha hepaticicola]
MARAIGTLPVPRAMDIPRPGKGTICLPEPMSNPRLPKGIRMDFYFLLHFRPSVSSDHAVPVDPALVENFTIDENAEVIRSLMATISSTSSAFTVSAPSYDTPMLRITARRLCLKTGGFSESQLNQSLLLKAELNSPYWGLSDHTQHLWPLSDS